MTDAEAITQKHADNRYNATVVAGPLYRVEVPGVPAAELRASDPEQAIERYNALCGITSLFGVKHSVSLLEEYPLPLPEEADAAQVGQ